MRRGHGQQVGGRRVGLCGPRHRYRSCGQLLATLRGAPTPNLALARHWLSIRHVERSVAEAQLPRGCSARPPPALLGPAAVPPLRLLPASPAAPPALLLRRPRCSGSQPLTRYLRATGGDAKHALKRIHDTLEWRRAERPEHIVCTACRANHKSHYMQVVGHDLSGRCAAVPLGMLRRAAMQVPVWRGMCAANACLGWHACSAGGACARLRLGGR